MTKEEMIEAMKTSGISPEYIAELEAMPEEQVAEELQYFGRIMKD